MTASASARLTIVGLGPGDPSLRTLATRRALAAATRIILRTRVHPGLADLADDARVSDCDDLYRSLPTFEAVYEAVAARVLAATASGDVVFAVPGHPHFGEESVRLLHERARERGLPVAVLPAVSAIDVVAVALGRDPMTEQAQIVDAIQLELLLAREPFAGGLLGIDPTRPCLVCQVYAPAVASAVKLALGRLYPDDHRVVVVRAAAVPGEDRVLDSPLFALDRQPVDHLTSVWIPPLPALAAYRAGSTLQRIVARLRAPGGCPWDRAQTHASLREAVIEEAYEVADAIDADDPANLAEELGDLLLQAALHAQIAEETGDFTLEDVFEQVNRKLIRRHPHVFGDAVAPTPADVIQTWDGIKAEERQARGDAPAAEHPLDRLPRSMPALAKATRLLLARPEPEARAAPPDAEALGDGLLEAVTALVRAGLNPDRELERALRRRFPSDPSPSVPNEQERALA